MTAVPERMCSVSTSSPGCRRAPTSGYCPPDRLFRIAGLTRQRASPGAGWGLLLSTERMSALSSVSLSSSRVSRYPSLKSVPMCSRRSSSCSYCTRSNTSTGWWAHTWVSGYSRSRAGSGAEQPSWSSSGAARSSWSRCSKRSGLPWLSWSRSTGIGTAVPIGGQHAKEGVPGRVPTPRPRPCGLEPQGRRPRPGSRNQ